MRSRRGGGGSMPRDSRRSRWLRYALPAHVDEGASRRVNYPDHYGRASRASKHYPGRVDVRDEPADRIDLSAPRAFGEHGRHVIAVDLGERARGRVAIQHEVVLRRGHDPLGPKRSVRMRSAGNPTRSSPSAATSTSAVGPQMKVRTSEPSGPLTSLSIASSMRRA